LFRIRKRSSEMLDLSSVAVTVKEVLLPGFETNMGKDLSKLPIRAKTRSGAVNPKEIFKSLTLRGTVQNIWEPQAEALSDWFDKHRQESDVVIQMSTGGGKTLVGLLIAQSMVNETKGKVVYVCPTNQLVEQVASKASECGIQVAIYMEGQWTNRQVFDTATGPCITNYAAVFNGRSVFRSRDIKGFVFDDAHVANNFVRNNFTIKIPSDHAAFKPIANLFRTYFARNSQIQEFDDALDGDWRALLFVPMFEVAQKFDQLRRLLIEHGADDNDSKLSFPWAHLKDRLSRSTVIISGSGIDITPPLLPVHTLPYFEDDVRRVYLTATMPSQVEFARTFGIAKPTQIIPGGKSGEAQRQFVFVTGDTDKDKKELALSLIEPYKACIIAPSDQEASEWCPPATKFHKASGNAGIEAFARSKGNDKLALAARYDGIDLPGDACRILVLAGLPVGESLIDRFTDQILRIERLRTAHVVTRVVQAIGRIFRSNTDHGAVLISSIELERWLSDPQIQAHMPELLQRQIEFGIELRRMVEEEEATFEDLLSAVLKGRRDWDKLYSDYVGAFAAQDRMREADWMIDFAEREREAFEKLWNGNYGAAAAGYASLAAEADAHDKHLAAWYRHWEGLSHMLNKDTEASAHAYVRAANTRGELGRPPIDAGLLTLPQDIKSSAQTQRIYKTIFQKKAAFTKKIHAAKENLKYGGDTNPVEQALCDLGAFLGLESSRPDKAGRTGPDVLWRSPAHKAGVALEAKTDKKPNGQYKKNDDIAQFQDHTLWLQKQHPGENYYKAIVGRKLLVSREANPPDDLRVIGLEQFIGLADRLLKLVEFVESTARDADLEITIERGVRYLGLTWPSCIESLESYLAIDLQHSEIPEPVSGD